MKLQVKQLDTETSNYIANALEHYAHYVWCAYNLRADKSLELAAEFKHSIPLLVSESYTSPVDDVQILGNEKGGQE